MNTTYQTARRGRGPATTATRPGRGRGDGGAVFAEFALVLPFFVLMVFGTVEFGQAYRQVNGLERAAASGARTGASAAKAWTADYDALRAINASAAGLNNVEVTRVVIWNARNADEPPAGCRAGTPSSSDPQCNVYSGAQLASESLAGFGVTGSGDDCLGGSWHASWCPTNRDNTRPDTDYVGVWIQGEYEGITGIIPADFTFETTAIYQIDPPTSFGD